MSKLLNLSGSLFRSCLRCCSCPWEAMKRPVKVLYLRSEGVFAFCSRGRISHLETEPISLFEQIRWGRSQYGNVDLVYPKLPERLPVILTSIGAGSLDTAAKLVRIADRDERCPSTFRAQRISSSISPVSYSSCPVTN